MADAPDDPAQDPAVVALVELITQLERTRTELSAAVERAHQLVELRDAGRPWLDIVRDEERPLIIERITRALDDLGAAGSRFRREEARALMREDMTITDVGKLFGVTRQRVSSLVQEPAADQP